MSIKRLDDGRYFVDVRPAGRNGKRIRRTFEKKSEAIAFEKHANFNFHEKEWLPKPTDRRPMSELKDIWWSLKGKHEEHGQSYLKKIERFIRMTGDLCPFEITTANIAQYCAERRGKGIKPSTINRELATVSGMFTVLTDAQLFSDTHPFRGQKPLKEEKPETGFLTVEEIRMLLSRLKGDNRKAAVFCLSTGARWGEAVRLKAEHVIENRISFVKTKTGKPRMVPISAEVAKELVRDKTGFLFPDVDYIEFRKTLRLVKPELPKGQATHAMRHSFATHFMINGGNILTLQRILGHARIEQTMVYAHFAPEFLNDAISLNPLRGKTDV